MKENNFIVSNNLLPSGFQDLTGVSAQKHFSILEYFVNYITKLNYNLIIPSVFEYCNDKQSNTIDVIDDLDNKLISLRSDITAQIERIWHKTGGKAPQKFCYYGDIFYKHNATAARKRTQAGFEFIATSDIVRDLEILNIVLYILEELDLSDYSLSLAFPNLFYAYCQSYNISTPDQIMLKSYLAEKNYSALAASKFKNLAEFITPNFTADKLNILGLDKEINYIIKLISDIQKEHPNLNIIIDPFNVKQYSYHTDFVFSVISHKLKKSVAKGGSYNISNTQSAAGSSFYIEELSAC